MRYVDIRELRKIMPPKLQQKLEEVTTTLISLPESERSAFIKRRAILWSKVKPYLVQLTGRFPEDYKCWYCEARDARSKYDVDHFRPKNQVKNKGCAAEPGYWWLAFDPMNYRLCCSLCNTPKRMGGETLGKWDQFPLKENSPRARNPQDNLNDEICLLLDPTKARDPGLIDFSDDGRVYPHCPEGNFLYQKAYISIGVLNLNDVRITERRKQLMQSCKEKLEEGDLEYQYYSQSGSASAEAALTKICNQILQMVSPYSAFSATALFYFCGSGRDWVISFLRHARII